MPISFCPWCGNILKLSSTDADMMAFYCRSCPYTSPVYKDICKKISTKIKELDDVLGGAESWVNVDATEALCPKNPQHLKAYFQQIQTRSADEPMTNFYKCVECGYRWKE